MENKHHIIFDLDGTLTQSHQGIINSARHALASYGIDNPDTTKLYAFIGPPLLDSFRQQFGFSEEKAKGAVARYREYYETKSWCENNVYDGIPAMLSGLRQQGCKLYVATSKVELFAVRILDYFGISQYFDMIAGASFDFARSSKTEVLQYLLQETGMAGCLSDAVMVGDRKYDILGAKAVGLDSIGVLYGYGNRDELEAAGANLIVATVAGLSDALSLK